MDELEDGTGWSWDPVPPSEWLVLAGTCLVLVVAGLLLIAQGAPLGHDESVYALRARYYAGDLPAFAWADYRAEGLPLLATPLVMLGGTEPEIRGLVLGFAVLLVLLTWALGRLLFESGTGLVAAALVAISPATLIFGWQVLLDVPAAAFGLAATLVLALAARGPRLRWFVLWAAPLAAAGAAVRYGAPLVVAAGMTGIGVARWRTLLADWVRTVVVAGTTVAAMAVVLFVPAVTNSGSPPYLAFRGRQVAKELSATASYDTFAGLLDDTFGLVVGGLVVLGVVTVVVVAVTGRRRPSGSIVAMAIAAGGFVVGLNASLAELDANYLVPLVPFAAILGGAGLANLLAARVAATVVAGLVVVVGLLPAWSSAQDSVDSADRAHGVIREIGRELDRRTDQPCLVMSSYSPQIGWYGGCPTLIFLDPDAPLDMEEQFEIAHRRFDLPANTPALVVVVEEGKRQPDDTSIDALLDRGTLLFEVGDLADGSRQYAEVIEVDPVDATAGG